MSSAILYVAIVAIWIGVLVPRWLRHEHAHDGHLRLRRFSLGGRQRASDAAARAGFSEDGHPRYTRFGGDVQADRPQKSADRPQKSPVTGPRSHNLLSQNYNSPYVSAPVSRNTGGRAQPYETDMVPSQVRSYGWSAEEFMRQERRHERGPRGGKRPGESPAGSHHDRHRDGEPVTASAASATPAASTGDSGERPGTAARKRQARMIRGRRRMLCMLLVLTVAVMCLAFLGPAAWWIAVPPVVLLTGYLLLLREAAHADAEARERQARERSAMARQAREARRVADAQRGTRTGSSPAWPAHETLPAAEIIDISARVGDQLYDQYADARLRAVGD